MASNPPHNCQSIYKIRADTSTIQSKAKNISLQGGCNFPLQHQVELALRWHRAHPVQFTILRKRIQVATRLISPFPKCHYAIADGDLRWYDHRDFKRQIRRGLRRARKAGCSQYKKKSCLYRHRTSTRDIWESNPSWQPFKPIDQLARRPVRPLYYTPDGSTGRCQNL